MSVRTEILSRFAPGAVGPPPLLLDLTLWHETHRQRGTLPTHWSGLSLVQVAADLATPAWVVARPWRIESPGIEVVRAEADGQRTVETRTPAGALTSRWSLGPDGSWWQTEYPVKTAEDLKVALTAVRARTYLLEEAGLAEQAQALGEQGILAIEIPTRPYADLLYDLVGMSEGFMLLMDDPPAARELVAVLEEKLQAFLPRLAGLAGDLCFSPDNLDGQFIYPAVFAEFMAASYRASAAILQSAGKPLVVHAGGPVGQLLGPLAESGVAAVEGIAPPPQSDASLSQARALAGPDLTLWGGIPQDYLLATRSQEEFETAVTMAAAEARADGRALLGVADRVPVDAEPTRLAALPKLAATATTD